MKREGEEDREAFLYLILKYISLRERGCVAFNLFV
jgi:hypothetical protein